MEPIVYAGALSGIYPDPARAIIDHVPIPLAEVRIMNTRRGVDLIGCPGTLLTTFMRGTIAENPPDYLAALRRHAARVGDQLIGQVVITVTCDEQGSPIHELTASFEPEFMAVPIFHNARTFTRGLTAEEVKIWLGRP